MNFPEGIKLLKECSEFTYLGGAIFGAILIFILSSFVKLFSYKKFDKRKNITSLTISVIGVIILLLLTIDSNSKKDSCFSKYVYVITITDYSKITPTYIFDNYKVVGQDREIYKVCKK